MPGSVEEQWLSDLGTILGSSKKPALKGKSLNAGYESEAEKVGWRAEDMKPEVGTPEYEVWEIYRELPVDRLTAAWNDKQREGGRFDNAKNGNVPMQGYPGSVGTANGVGYVVDAESGEAFQFKMTAQRAKLSDEQKEKLEVGLKKVQAIEDRVLQGTNLSRDELKRVETLLNEMENVDKSAKDAKASIFQANANLNDPYFTEPAKRKEQKEIIEKAKKALELSEVDSARFTQELEELKKVLKIPLEEACKAVKSLENLEVMKSKIAATLSADSIPVWQHHSSPTQGKDVAGAGEMDYKDGRITKISNVSGHYKPQFVHLAQTIEHLMRMGFMLSQKVTYIDDDGKGQPLTAESNPKLFKLYEKVKDELAKLPSLQKDVAAKQQELDVELEDSAKQELEAEIEKLKKQIEPIEKGLALLNKMGVGAENKPEAKVQFLDGIQGKAGHEIHQMKNALGDHPDVNEFLSTGGGQKTAKGDSTVAQAKGNVLDELKQKTKEKRESLDEDAEKGRAGLLKLLKAKMSPEAYKEFIAKNEKITDEALEEALEAIKKAEQADASPEELAINEELAKENADTIQDAFSSRHPEWQHKVGYFSEESLKDVLLGRMHADEAAQSQNIKK